MRSLLGYLRGTKPLWKAFWGVWVGGTMVFMLVTPVLVSLLTGGVSIWFLLGNIVVVMYIYTPLGVFVSWRCAPNTSSQVWMYLVRGWALIWGLGWAIGIASIVASFFGCYDNPS